MDTLLQRLVNGEKIEGESSDGWKYNAVMDMPAFNTLKVWAISPNGENGAVASLGLKDFPKVYGKICWN